MSFLPYEGGSTLGWLGAFSGSAIAHAAVLVGVLGGYGDLFTPDEPSVQNTNFVVSFERLDTDDLTGITEHEGDTASNTENDGESGDQDDQSDQNNAGEAIPEEPAPVLEDVETPDLVPEAVSPLPVETVDTSPVVPLETVAPVQTISSTSLSSGTVESVTSSNEATKPSESTAEPSAQDLAIGELITRIRAAVSDPCLVAIPRRDGEEGIGLELLASTDRAMERFSQDVLTAEDSDLRQTRILIDPRQCPVLTYIRKNRSYPAMRMGLRLETTSVPSGGSLTGVLRGGAGRFITLLLIDDNGVVQDLQRFMSFSGNLARFEVPVTRNGPSRDTSQIILALATRRAATSIRDKNGDLAQDVFSGLSGELSDNAVLAIATFDVR